MGQREGIDSSKACPRTPTLEKKLIGIAARREMIAAVSLTLILTTAGLVYYWMLPKALPIIDEDPVEPTIYAVIAIDGDANFSDTALQEGWPGDGSPGNPFIIDGLNIDLAGRVGHCIMISNARVSFTISNCNLTGAGESSSFEWGNLGGAGILLKNVTHGELVNNTCSSNDEFGIDLRYSNSNTITGNTANSNWAGISVTQSSDNTISGNTALYNGINGIWVIDGNNNTIAANLLNDNGQGITLRGHDNIITGNTANNNGDDGIGITDGTNNIMSGNTACNNYDYGLGLHRGSCNTISSNIANSNSIGIYLEDSDYNTVINNTCKYNGVSISLLNSHHNTVENNAGNSNKYGISLDDSHYNTVTDNICNYNGRGGISLHDSTDNTVANNIYLATPNRAH